MPTALRQRFELGSTQIVVWLCRCIVGVVLASLVYATLHAELQTLRTSIIPPAYPPLVYLLMPSPGTSPEPGAPGAAGADFSQVYTSALAVRHGESAYFPKTLAFADRFGRPAGYPPLTNWLGVPLTFLPYHAALLVHVGVSLALLFATTAYILWRMGLRQHVPRALLAQASLYFLTPVGFTHTERGQFDLIVASASALAVAGTFLPGRGLATAAASGLLGALKWTSVPFLGCFSVFGFALSRRRWSYVLLLTVMALGTLAFWRELAEYWYTIRVFELDAAPRGITLQHYLPRSLSRCFPAVLTGAVIALALARGRSDARREALSFALSAPLSILLMGLAACYAATSYEYHAVGLLGAVPGLIVWLERNPSVPAWLKALTAFAFGVFVCLAFRTFKLAPPFHSNWMARNYGLFSLLMLGICAGVVARASLPPSDEGSATARPA